MSYNERIDKIISSKGEMSRREVKAAAKKGRIAVNGKVVKSTAIRVSDSDLLTLDGITIYYEPFLYIMLNKPDGYVSSHDQPGLPTVFDLLTGPEKNIGLFSVGRLDKDTLGLLILTNDGEAAHQLLSPKRNVEKRYFFKTADIVSESALLELCSGITLADGFTAKPAKVELNSDKISGIITITEGKYHQIKRMFGATGNKIVYLERKSFASLELDESLERGQWRQLQENERNLLLKNVIRH